MASQQPQLFDRDNQISVYRHRKVPLYTPLRQCFSENDWLLILSETHSGRSLKENPGICGIALVIRLHDEPVLT